MADVDRRPSILTTVGALGVSVLMLFAPEARAAPADRAEVENRGVVPSTRENPCATNGYRQVAASLPVARTSDGDEGHPWRAMYGYCVAGRGKFSLHQDWVVSYLDARPTRGSPGGSGVSFGTDFSLEWRHRQGGSPTPYYELGVGVQYAAGTAFPAHGSRLMFTINVGAGLLFPVRTNLRMKTALRYLHLSNAGVLSDNAGYDGVHLLVGLQWNI
jgi:hypothetical protein